MRICSTNIIMRIIYKMGIVLKSIQRYTAVTTCTCTNGATLHTTIDTIESDIIKKVCVEKRGGGAARLL